MSAANAWLISMCAAIADFMIPELTTNAKALGRCGSRKKAISAITLSPVVALLNKIKKMISAAAEALFKK